MEVYKYSMRIYKYSMRLLLIASFVTTVIIEYYYVEI